MPRFLLKQHKAVWETTTVEVDAPDTAYVQEHVDELIAAAVENDEASLARGDAVENVPSEFEIYDEHGACLAGAGATAALLVQRAWLAAYRVCDTDGEQIAFDEVRVTASGAAEATTRAIAWVNDNDPRCDPRIDYRVEVVRVEPVEADDDEQDDPAG